MKVNEIQYHTEVKQWNASRPDLILLHGFMGSGDVFSSLIRKLRPFCNPITIDLLGHGKTGGADEASRFEIEQQLDDLQEVIDHLSVSNPYLYGYSMGGRLALRYALRYPDDLSGMILESTHYGIEDEEKRTQRKRTDKTRAEAIEKDFESFLEDWQQLPIFQNGISLPNEKMNRYVNIQRSQDARQMAMSLRGFGTAQMSSVKDDLPDLNLPTLLLAGQADLKYAEINREMEAQLPNSQFSIIPHAGHRIHLEHPQAVASALQIFIQKV